MTSEAVEKTARRFARYFQRLQAFESKHGETERMWEPSNIFQVAVLPNCSPFLKSSIVEPDKSAGPGITETFNALVESSGHKTVTEDSDSTLIPSQPQGTHVDVLATPCSQSKLLADRKFPLSSCIRDIKGGFNDFFFMRRRYCCRLLCNGVRRRDTVEVRRGLNWRGRGAISLEFSHRLSHCGLKQS